MQINAAGTHLRARDEPGRGDMEPPLGNASRSAPDTDLLTPDLCVIGAGASGLAAALGAAAFGRSVILVEKHKMGGVALNCGSIPTKALAAAVGIAGVEPAIDHRAVHHHVKGVIASLAPNDSVERLRGLGVRVILAAARFIDRQTITAGDYRIQARRFIIATGSSPAIPEIAGLDETPFFTPETIFDNDTKIPHLLIIGGGSQSLELAQAYRRLGSEVSVLIEGECALPAEDPEAAAVVLRRLRAEGVAIHEGLTLERAERARGQVRLYVRADAYQDIIEGSHLLVAAGRKPNISDLNLDAARIKTSPAGIRVNGGLRTANRRVYAIGSVTGKVPQGADVSRLEAGAVLSRTLFRWPQRIDRSLAPRVTFTDPELAHIGLTEAEAADRKLKVHALRAAYFENSRATAEAAAEGHIKVLAGKNGRILGATIAGPNACELIHVWSLAMAQGLRVQDVSASQTPYPAFSEISRRAAERFAIWAPKNSRVRRIIALLAKLG